MTDTLFQSTTGIAAQLRAGQLSARELAELVLDRVDAVNPAVNAVVEAHREAALRAADDADHALTRGGPTGSLHGVPMTIKESFQVAGMRSTWGNPAFAGYVADRDAVVVSRLRSAGAVLFGTTNVAQMLADVAGCANPLYGRTGNPWDTTRSPGGSTGGGAAAVAAGRPARAQRPGRPHPRRAAGRRADHRPAARGRHRDHLRRTGRRRRRRIHPASPARVNPGLGPGVYLELTASTPRGFVFRAEQSG
jgi:Amidase